MFGARSGRGTDGLGWAIREQRGDQVRDPEEKMNSDNVANPKIRMIDASEQIASRRTRGGHSLRNGSTATAPIITQRAVLGCIDGQVGSTWRRMGKSRIQPAAPMSAITIATRASSVESRRLPSTKRLLTSLVLPSSPRGEDRRSDAECRPSIPSQPTRRRIDERKRRCDVSELAACNASMSTPRCAGQRRAVRDNPHHEKNPDPNAEQLADVANVHPRDVDVDYDRRCERACLRAMRDQGMSHFGDGQT